MRSFARSLTTVLLLTMQALAAQAQSSQPKALYADALERERLLRNEVETAKNESARASVLTRLRTLVRSYDDMARLFPASGYADNALWQGAALSADAFWQFGEAVDRSTAMRLFTALKARFPTSALARQVASQAKRLQDAKVPEAASPEPARARPTATVASPAPSGMTALPAAFTSIKREVLPEVLRITLEVGREVTFYDERIDGPPRVFLDLQNTRSVEALKDAVIRFPDDVVRQIRVGRHLDARTRVVMDLQGMARYSVYTLYDPYRIVVDFERKRALAPTPVGTIASAGKKPALATVSAAPTSNKIAPIPVTAVAPTSDTLALTTLSAIGPTRDKPAPTPVSTIAPTSDSTIAPTSDKPAPTSVSTLAPTRDSAIAPATTPPAPALPSTNVAGGFSLSRQLGLGIARIVIDPGHGGHDPGAKARGLTEADLVLDVALRLEKLLKDAGVDVVMTRRTDAFVSLEERTAIANRVGADLFLSVHSNASANDAARGVETYFLNFAPNPQAEAVAARENAGGARTMRSLPDIVRAIALNNKIDESRDFASIVQTSLYTRLQKTNRTVKNLGVKQAPFLVLIGATMPSVLAEISFITNRQEATLLKTEKYKQQIADALFAGVARYQQALKKVPAIAATVP